MNIKKILTITIVVLALFGCMSAASAGWFDFLNSEPANETYNFTVFSLQLPENASISNYTNNDFGDSYKVKTYTASFGTDKDNNKGTISIMIMNGTNLVDNIDQYISNWQRKGAVYEGKYGDWSILNIDNATREGTNSTYNGYLLARHNGDNLVSILCENLTMLKNIADTYKPI